MSTLSSPLPTTLTHGASDSDHSRSENLHKLSTHHNTEGKKSEQSMADGQEKSEDGTENRMTNELRGIEKSTTTSSSNSVTGSPIVRPTRLPSYDASAGGSGSGSPMMAKMYLLQRRQSSDSLPRDKSGHPQTLEAPIDPLLAPLDCPRPDGSTPTTPPGKNSSPVAQSSSSVTSSPHKLLTRSSSFSSLEASDQPNALDVWDSIQSELRGKQLVVFLDYDGTLTPIVSQPSAAIIDEAQRARVGRLASKLPVAIVTGRKLDTIKKFLLRGEAPAGLSSLFYAGSHGFDIDCPASVTDAPTAQRHSKCVGEEFLPHLERVRDLLTDELKSIEGAMVEDNKFTVSVHYRNVVKPDDRAQLHLKVRSVMKPFEEKGLLRLTQGHMVHEIRANFDWHKGAAVNYLMQLMCANLPETVTQDKIVPIYIGDDTTDEDAFRTLRSYTTTHTHPLSYSIFVRADDKVRPSVASHVLTSPQQVGMFLEKLTQLE